MIEHTEQVKLLAEKLLKQETVGIDELTKILGKRENRIKVNVEDYTKNLEKRTREMVDKEPAIQLNKPAATKI